MKPYGNQSKQKASKEFEEFTSSISFDKRLCVYDVAGSIAHVKMLGKQGIVSRKERDAIISGLMQVLAELKSGPCKTSEGAEDIHMAIESALVEKVGDIGGKMHTARSRNDQVALDLRLYLRCEIAEILGLVASLQSKLLILSKKHKTVVFRGILTCSRHSQCCCRTISWRIFTNCRGISTD